MTQRIMELARTLGRVSSDEEELLDVLCGTAQTELTAALKEGICPEDCSEAFALAGAWLVLAGLEVSRGAGQAQSFTAGDVTIRSASAADKADMLRAQAKRLMSAWTNDYTFVFYGV